MKSDSKLKVFILTLALSFLPSLSFAADDTREKLASSPSTSVSFTADDTREKLASSPSTSVSFAADDTMERWSAESPSCDRIPTVEEFPILMAYLLGASSEMGSAVPILCPSSSNRIQYLLTSAHTRMLHAPKELQVAMMSPQCELLRTSKGQIIFFETLKKNKGTECKYSVKFFGTLRPLTTEEKGRLSEENFTRVTAEFESSKTQSLSWKHPDMGIFENRCIQVRKTTYLIEGSDLALLKYINPQSVAPGKKMIRLPELNEVRSLIRYPAFVAGYSCFLSKQAEGVGEHKDGGVVLQPDFLKGSTSLMATLKIIPVRVRYCEALNLFCGARLTPGGIDDNVLHPGMSGGGLFFLKNGRYVLGGIVSQTLSRNSIEEHIKGLGYPPLSIYDVYTSFSREILASIRRQISE